jgi:predicted pyridoxine 5'-phosphate oxidase superfamily flavin-nucleotide-binding protein
MPFRYADASRTLQDRFDTRRLADRLADVKVHHAFTGEDLDFIHAQDMFFLATVDEQGQPTCSYKGGAPGFVTVLDETTLAFPNYDGNGMFLSMGNIAHTGRVGLLFVDFERQRRLRVDGIAELAFEHPAMDVYPECQFVVLVRATAIYPNCPRYVHQHTAGERSPFVPRRGVTTPTPDWKRSDWARDVLASSDPATNRT